MTLRSLSLIAAVLCCTAAGPSRIEYFSNVRQVQPAQANTQNYVIVDTEIWDHARFDLADLRLYDNSAEVPYALQVERGENGPQQHDVKILNLGTSGSATEFVVDVAEVPEYDDLTLDVSASDFVTQATIEGADELRGSRWTKLATGTLFDFTREKLGNSFTLRFPPSRFRYLRVHIARQIKPQQVLGAKVAMQQERKALWTPVDFSNASPPDKSRDTLRVLQASDHVPIERIEFVIAPSAVNFRRDVEVRDDNGSTVASGTVTRIRMRRGQTTAEKEAMTIDLPSGTLSKHYDITIRNGDDRPLPIQDIRLLSIQRRVYFNAPSDTPLKLYYGDPKLTAPTYDYAKLFHREDTAVPATLGSGRHNPDYTGRPDDRPWTERHGWVLWAALVVAVLGLGVVALRSLKTPA